MNPLYSPETPFPVATSPAGCNAIPVVMALGLTAFLSAYLHYQQQNGLMGLTFSAKNCKNNLLIRKREHDENS
jgi:hypothetical protein